MTVLTSLLLHKKLTWPEADLGKVYTDIPPSLRPWFWGSHDMSCRDGLKNSRDKSATSPFASWKRESRRRCGQINGDAMALSWTSRGSQHSGTWAYLHAS